MKIGMGSTTIKRDKAFRKTQQVTDLFQNPKSADLIICFFESTTTRIVFVSLKRGPLQPNERIPALFGPARNPQKPETAITTMQGIDRGNRVSVTRILRIGVT